MSHVSARYLPAGVTGPAEPLPASLKGISVSAELSQISDKLDRLNWCKDQDFIEEVSTDKRLGTKGMPMKPLTHLVKEKLLAGFAPSACGASLRFGWAGRAWRNLPRPLQERLRAAPLLGSMLRDLGALHERVRELEQSVRQLSIFPPGHFYSPFPDLDEVRARRQALFDPEVMDTPGVRLNEDAQLALVRTLVPFYDEQPFPEQPAPDFRYRFVNGFYSYGDGILLYCMLRHLRPRHYLEIGSGFSSALALDTNERFLGGQMRMTLIEPYPDRLLSLLRPGDKERMELVRSPLQAVDLDLIRGLGPGDVLFIDSTHVSKVGSDVNRIFFQFLPLLQKGVYVHFHDIFFPFEYPECWIFEGRAWTETYLLRAFLQYNDRFEIVLFNSFLRRRHPALFSQHMPLTEKNPGASIWLRRV